MSTATSRETENNSWLLNNLKPLLGPSGAFTCPWGALLYCTSKEKVLCSFFDTKEVWIRRWEGETLWGSAVNGVGSDGPY